MRAVMIAACGLAPCAIAFPLVADEAPMLVLLALTVFLSALPTGAAAAALQAVTPNQMRAQVSALYLFFANLIGMGIGPALVGFFTDFVLGDAGQLNLALSLTAAVTLPAAALILALGLRPYRESMAAAKAWEETP
jgi:MFS family permease